ncbi:protein phosphatase PP2A regulatory subunit A, putative [Plasmodium gallinaceum]|uniref:Protein phosphatase PP2A regulatory subunit A, putative n=1 Tax=Plasmodium gallinaceum TaxID=5849 RepID=A0A1J1H232_PLAGA|nr:protein phosphatase PP2A regulatory subunit A, putative [Plasmodium gallinaceum]CRG97587.1 protein phosphatase PP2A regulatory subunit A, putative [Plasmodium gallinaceum]
MCYTKAQEIIDGIQSSDCKIRLKYVKGLKFLCEIIGHEKTKNELIEFLYNIIEDDSDVLNELSNHLIFLTNFINDVNNCEYLCDLILSFLIKYEKEININGYNAFKIYIQKCDSSTLINVIYPKIIKLAENESDNYRIGVSKILPLIIERCIYENQSKYTKIFIYLFMELCQDQCILVKKSCCDKFCDFLKILKSYRHKLNNHGNSIKSEEQIKANSEEIRSNSDTYKVNKDNTKKDFLKHTKNNRNKQEKQEEREKKEDENNKELEKNELDKREENDMEEEDDQEKILFIEKLWKKSKEIYSSFFYSINGLDEVQISAVTILSEILNNDINFVNNIEHILTNICNDDSWRVRAILANNIHEILKILKNSDLSMIVLLLLKDLDSNVRSIILNNLDKILTSSKITINIIDEVFDDLKRDIDSNNLHLKISLCRLLCSLPDILDKNGSIEYILPLFLLFIRIEETDLKSELFVCLHKISKLISFFDMKQIIIPLCHEIVKNKNWRLKYSLYYYLKFFDHFFFFQNKENITSNYKDFWNYIDAGAKDLVYSIRIAVVETLEFLIKNKNFNFFEKGITYLLNDLKQSSNYILRINCLQYISKLIIYFPLKYIENNILNIIDELSKDKISNIRYNIVKTIYYINNYIKHVLCIIKNNKYDELINNVTDIVNNKNKENHQNFNSSSDNSQYFHILEKKSKLLTNHMNSNDSFLIDSSSISSLSFYDNMKNTDTNKKSCEFILNFLSDMINFLSIDNDYDVSKASISLKNNDFFFYVNPVKAFNAVCKPIK